MKIRTNLTSSELELVAKGLLRAAETEGHYRPENPAERMLNQKIDVVFSTFCNSLAQDIERILKKEE